MDDMNKVADKIQKLLNLAGNNPNQEEAQAALLKAQALMVQYNIDMESFDGEEKIEYSYEISKVQSDPRDRQVLNIIAAAFACKPLISANRKCSFFGRKDNAQAAKTCMEFINKVMERGINQSCKDHGLESSSVRGAAEIYNMYAAGFIKGLKEAIDAQTLALAVVVPEDVKDAFAEKFPNIGAYRGRAAVGNSRYQDSYKQGYSDGKSAMDKTRLKA